MDLQSLSNTLFPALTDTIQRAVFFEAERQGYRIVPPGQVPIPRNRPEAQLMILLAQKWLVENPEPDVTEQALPVDEDHA